MRPGNPMPRTVEVSAGMLHALGLPNPGLTGFISETLPTLQHPGYPVIGSILGESLEEWTHLAEALTATGALAGLELNLALADPRQVETEQEALARITEAIQAVRAATSLSLIAKLPSIGAEIGALASAAELAGADAIAVSQSPPGIVVRLNSRQFRLPGAVGGLSGPCIKPLALYQVWRVAQSVSIPILGGGGVMNGADALEFLLAGASTVAVGIANLIHPNAIADITEEIRVYLTANGIASLSELIGFASGSLPH